MQKRGERAIKGELINFLTDMIIIYDITILVNVYNIFSIKHFMKKD